MIFLTTGKFLRAFSRAADIFFVKAGGIEEASDIVMMMYRPKYYFKEQVNDVAEVIVEKHRNGPVGTIVLNFQDQFTRFTNHDAKHDDQNPFLPDDKEKI